MSRRVRKGGKGKRIRVRRDVGHSESDREAEREILDRSTEAVG